MRILTKFKQNIYQLCKNSSNNLAWTWLISAPITLIVISTLFIWGSTSYFIYLDYSAKANSIYHDLPWINQKIYLRFQNTKELIHNILRRTAPFEYEKNATIALFQEFKKNYSEVDAIYSINAYHELNWHLSNHSRLEDSILAKYFKNGIYQSISSSEVKNQIQQNSIENLQSLHGNSETINHEKTEQIIEDTQNFEKIQYKNYINNLEKSLSTQTIIMHQQKFFLVQSLPLLEGQDVISTLVIVYNLNALIENLIPKILTHTITKTSYFDNHIGRYSLNLLPSKYLADKLDLNLLAYFNPEHKEGYDKIVHQTPFLVASELNLQAVRFFNSQQLQYLILLAIASSITLLIIWSLLTLRRYVKQNIDNQLLLAKEIAFRSAIGDSALLAICTVNMDNTISYINPMLSSLLLVDARNFIGKHLNKTLLEPLLNSLHNSQEFEKQLLKQDGSTFYAKIYISPLINQNKQIGWLISLIDITQSQQTSQVLRLAYQQFFTVLEGLEVAICVMPIMPIYQFEDNNYTLLYSNRHYQNIFGSDNNKHIELLNAYQQQQKKQQKQQNISAQNSFNKQGQIENQEIYLANLDGWFNVQSRFIQWVDGRLVEMMIAVDITEIKRSQEETRMNEQQWHFANRLSNMGEMASSLAHELNQPLTAINIYCQGLLKRIDTTKNPPFIIEAIEKTAKQANKAGEIIKKLKQFIHKASFEKKWVSIQTIMLDALELIQLSFFKQSNVQLTVTEEVIMYVDPVLIEQVLVNLIKNAIESNQQAAINKAIDAKNLLVLINIEQIELNSNIIGEAIHQKFLQICITDQGVGVAPEHMNKLFDAFYSTKHSGMGMGLKICRSIIESHEGQLIMQNNSIEGCTFTVRLPILSKN